MIVKSPSYFGYLGKESGWDWTPDLLIMKQLQRTAKSFKLEQENVTNHFDNLDKKASKSKYKSNDGAAFENRDQLENDDSEFFCWKQI